MRKREKFFVFFLAMLTVFCASAANAQSKPDKMRVVNITADYPITDGVENDFTIEIEYTLESMDEGTLAIGFNLNDLNGFRMLTRKKIKKGTNSIKNFERLGGTRRFYRDGKHRAVSDS